MGIEEIALVVFGIFWTLLIGSTIHRFRVPLVERREYDAFVKRFSYVTALITLGSIVCWMGDHPWTRVIDFFSKDENVAYIRWAFHLILWGIAFTYFIIIWRRRPQ